MNQERRLYYDAGPINWFWGADHNDKMHLRFAYTLDHQVNGEELLEAWKKTLKVYPVINCIPDGSSGHMLFYETDLEPVVYESEYPIAPCRKISAERGVSVTYWKDTVVFTTYHSILDGMGAIGVAKTLVYFYCCIHFRQEFDSTGIMIKEGRIPEEYFVSDYAAKLGEYHPVPLKAYPEGIEFFQDRNMVSPQDGIIPSACFSLPKAQFMKRCKSIGANPTAMLCMIFGKATYALYPEENRRLALSVTISWRDALGIPETIAPCSSAVILSATHDELIHKEYEKIARKLRDDLNEQRQPDYIKTAAAFARTYAMFQEKVAGVLSYEGNVEVGGCGEHVHLAYIVNHSSNTLHLLEQNDRFYAFCQFGKSFT
ncbi:MAG: hypothetical protein HUJ72_07535, partial [Blautia sp.]|nr:hypothetical protein [Blautia sp.]